MATRKRANDWTYLLMNGDTIVGGTNDLEIADAHAESANTTVIDLTDQVEEVEDLREEEEPEEEDEDEDEEP